jgi:hypothetical protein
MRSVQRSHRNERARPARGEEGPRKSGLRTGTGGGWTGEGMAREAVADNVHGQWPQIR